MANDRTGTNESTVFLGDSITEVGRWDEWFPEMNALNLGVGGNTTEDVIARRQEVIDAEPHTVVLLIGTNDLSNRRSGPEHIVRNIETILVTLRRDLPGARLVMQSVLPRGREFTDRVHEINVHLRQFCPVVKAEWVDVWPALAMDDGELNPEYTDDRLHLNEAGYTAWVDVLRPALEGAPQHDANERRAASVGKSESSDDEAPSGNSTGTDAPGSNGSAGTSTADGAQTSAPTTGGTGLDDVTGPRDTVDPKETG
ncbi:GDSL-type esterase/lipase family protein [Planctomonas psychrotolerans]|uniref:GDSL-type esterase/lipase family protein n=1 Tax=Planctomonas psychrotolerans TaxID=2528712 RepID=UPI00123C0642|nr:GDSL-type esterase/lipase family protein [Planctomonas psychrotolerans]